MRAHPAQTETGPFRFCSGVQSRTTTFHGGGNGLRARPTGWAIENRSQQRGGGCSGTASDCGSPRWAAAKAAGQDAP